MFLFVFFKKNKYHIFFFSFNPTLVVEWCEAAHNGPKGCEFEPPPQIYPYAGPPGSILLLPGVEMTWLLRDLKNV